MPPNPESMKYCGHCRECIYRLPTHGKSDQRPIALSTGLPYRQKEDSHLLGSAYLQLSGVRGTFAIQRAATIAKEKPMQTTYPTATYPVQFSVDYPDRLLDRMSTFFRIFIAIPILIVLGAVSAGTWQSSANGRTTYVALGAGGLLTFGPLLMIVFRQKYPRWWFDWNLQLMRFSNRVAAFMALMDDRYPSTDEEQSVHLDFPYPDVPRDLNRWLPLVKWFLAIPHYFCLIFLGIAAV